MREKLGELAATRARPLRPGLPEHLNMEHLLTSRSGRHSGRRLALAEADLGALRNNPQVAYGAYDGLRAAGCHASGGEIRRDIYI